MLFTDGSKIDGITNGESYGSQKLGRFSVVNLPAFHYVTLYLINTGRGKGLEWLRF